MRADKLKGQSAAPLIDLPEDYWRAIEASLDITRPRPSFRRRLSHSVQIARAQSGPPSFGTVGGPKVPHVRRLLSKLQKDAKRLADTLSKLQLEAPQNADASLVLYQAILHWVKLVDNGYPKIWDAIELADFQDLRRDLPGQSPLRQPEAQVFMITAVGLLAAASEQVIETLPRSAGGAPVKNDGLQELIATLALFYRNETERRPTITTNPIKGRYQGRFFEFLRTCVDAFMPDLKLTDSALGKSAHRVLKDIAHALGKDTTRSH